VGAASGKVKVLDLNNQIASPRPIGLSWKKRMLAPASVIVHSVDTFRKLAAYYAREERIEKARTFATSRQREVERGARSLANALQSWLLRIARREARRVRWPRSRFEKADPWTQDELELTTLLERYGLRQYKNSAVAAARSVGSRWEISPEVKRELYAEIENKVVLIVNSTREQIKESLKQIVDEALGEEPRPSVDEVSRRIARQWHASGLKPLRLLTVFWLERINGDRAYLVASITWSNLLTTVGRTSPVRRSFL